MLRYTPQRSIFALPTVTVRSATPIVPLRGGGIANIEQDKVSLARAIREAREEHTKSLVKKINHATPLLDRVGKKSKKKTKRKAEIERPEIESNKHKEEESDEPPKKKLKPAQYLLKIVQSQLEKTHKKEVEKQLPREHISIDKVKEYIHKAAEFVKIDLSEMTEGDVSEIHKRWATSLPKLAKSLVFFIIDLVRKQRKIRIKIRPYLMRRLVTKAEKELLNVFQGQPHSDDHFQYLVSVIKQGIKSKNGDIFEDPPKTVQIVSQDPTVSSV